MSNKSLFLIVLFSIVLSFVVFVFKSSVALSANTVEYKSKRITNLLIPEGWGFFTRNPREATLQLYELKDSIDQPVLKPNASAEFFFGASRRNRKVAMEISEVLGEIPQSSWIKTKGSYSIPDTIVTVKASESIHYLRGKYLAVMYVDTPWAWARHPERHTKEYSCVAIDVVK